MLYKIFITLMLYVSFIVCVYIKGLAVSRKEKATVAVLFVGSLYFAVSFVLGESWPNIDDITRLAFLNPMKQIIEALHPGQT